MPRRGLCTRRDALGLTLSALIPACRSKKEQATSNEEAATSAAGHEPAALNSAPLGSEPFGGLEVKQGGDLSENERGGTTVVLLHGFGAAGDDLVSLARALRQPRTRYVVPAGLLEAPGGAGGRAWWMLKQRPAYDDEQELVVASESLAKARAAVLGVVSTIRERYAPQSLFIAGFSQGAMLALDVAAHPSSAIDRVAVLSGALPQSTSALLAKPRRKRPLAFVSHGRQDRILRFAGGERLVERLKASGHDVTFQPFEGGHEIPSEISGTLRDFFAPA